jgi:hypothetical protein
VLGHAASHVRGDAAVERAVGAREEVEVKQSANSTFRAPLDAKSAKRILRGL